MSSDEVRVIEGGLVAAIANPSIGDLAKLRWIMERSEDHRIPYVAGDASEVVAAAQEYLRRVPDDSVWILDELFTTAGDELGRDDAIESFDCLWMNDDLLLTARGYSWMLWVFHYGLLAMPSIAALHTWHE